LGAANERFDEAGQRANVMAVEHALYLVKGDAGTKHLLQLLLQWGGQ
jgi:hypothetical protein